jgi:hypothetical protein
MNYDDEICGVHEGRTCEGQGGHSNDQYYGRLRSLSPKMEHLRRGAVYIAASVHGVPANRLRDSSEFFFRQGDVARVDVAENARGAPVCSFLSDM